MIRKHTAACLLAALISFTGDLKAVFFGSERERKYWPAPPARDDWPPEETGSGSDQAGDRLPEELAIKAPPQPRPFPGSRPLPKPQPTPKPTPPPPGVTPPTTPTPQPTKPPVTRPT